LDLCLADLLDFGKVESRAVLMVEWRAVWMVARLVEKKVATWGRMYMWAFVLGHRLEQQLAQWSWAMPLVLELAKLSEQLELE